MDVYSRDYSVHNALPFRNLTVKQDSGEPATIRVEDHLGKRSGLNSLLARHSGKFGIDSTYGTVKANDYNASPSFTKQHRNTSRRLEYSGTSIVTGSSFDNSLVSSTLPRSEFQYSWINSALS